MSFQYSPGLSYEFKDGETDIDQFLNVKAQRNMSSKWLVTFADRYKYTDDSETYYTTAEGDQTSGADDGTETEDTLSRDQTGRRYWTNAASIRTSYALYEHTMIDGGYTYSVLRNEQGSRGSDYDEYDKHAFSAGLQHDFNPNWRSSIGANVIRGLFDSSSTSSSSNSDLYQYGLSTRIDYVHSNLDAFPFKYSLTTTDYDTSSRSGTTAHQWSLGWEHAMNQHTRVSIGGGPSYAVTEGLDGEWSYNAYLNFSQKFEHTSYSLQLTKEFETNNFSGTDESGLEDTYNARFNIAHQYTKALRGNMFARYSKQSQLDPQGIYRTATGITPQTTTGDNTYDKDIYEAGVGLNYAFNQWYSLGLRYSYYVSEGQLDSDQYDEHRVILSLDMSKELFRW